ncbi:MAG: CFI-box-CTERM domain-containing protein [Bacillota bacterium]|nr:CFI-box-CTERM domain-containing protein [Bacillota bacterium]
MAESLYDVLSIFKESTSNEIKKAYIEMVREYPPEKNPEQFKKIRKAYEILSNPDSRHEYDTMATYGDEIRLLEEESNNAIEHEEYNKAISCFKKILMIEPNLHNIRNQLGITYTKSREFDKALKQFRKLIEIHPDNAIYRTNLAFACENLGLTEEAIDNFKQAILLDPNDVNIVYWLSDLYIQNSQYTLARKSIEDAILLKDNEGFHKFFYLFKLVELDIIERNVFEIEKTFSRIEELLENHPEEKAYVAREYGKLAFELNEVMMFDWAKKLTERAVQLNPADEDIIELHSYTNENEALIKNFQLLEKDEKVLDPFKHAAYLYIYGSSLEEEKYKESCNIMFENFDFIVKNRSAETISSIKRIMIKYPAIYDVRKELLSSLMEQATEFQQENDQYDQMLNDSTVTNSLKRLIALYLSNFKQDERSRYFDDIIDEMSYEQEYKVRQGIDRLKLNYPALYKLNPDFLEEIKKKLNDVRPVNNQTSQFVPQAKTTYQSGSTSNSTSNSSGCFVATAAFGSPLVAELDRLRFWRDQYLKKSRAGRIFVSFYYKVGPSAAAIVRHSPLLRKMVRNWVWKILSRLENKYSIQSQMEIKRKGDIKRWKNV